MRKKLRAKDYVTKWRLVKIANLTNCVDCGKMIFLKEGTYTGPTGLIFSGFRCPKCEQHKWDNV